MGKNAYKKKLNKLRLEKVKLQNDIIILVTQPQSHSAKVIKNHCLMKIRLEEAMFTGEMEDLKEFKGIYATTNKV